MSKPVLNPDNIITSSNNILHVPVCKTFYFLQQKEFQHSDFLFQKPDSSQILLEASSLFHLILLRLL